MSRMPERRPSIQVSEILTSSSPAQQGSRILALPAAPVSQFDTVETRFFKEGDELSALPAAMDSFDDPTGFRAIPLRAGKHTLWLASLAATLALCGIVLLWNARHDARASVLSAPATATAAPPVAPAMAAVPTAVPATPPIPTPAAVLSSPPSAQPTAAGAVPTEPSHEALDACKKAYDRHRAKDVVLSCGQAFASNPQSAEIAVMLAKTEFERGHARQSLDWARKALVLDESQADAYVFLGGGEQAAGHAAAARAAYRRYLQLSPQGRYAADLRAVLRSL